MDLSQILTDYETYFELKFGKPPKLSRKLKSEEVEALQKGGKAKDSSAKKQTKLPSIVSSEETVAKPLELQGTTIRSAEQSNEPKEIERLGILYSVTFIIQLVP